MVPEKYSLAAVARHLLALFEVRRPGIARWDAEAQERFRREADAALRQMEQQCRELGVDDPPHWQRARSVVNDALLPRYGRLAEAENAAAARDYGMWRGGDLVARAAFALCGLVLGAIAVAVPWIPVQEKWVPWALFVLGPFLPDAYAWWYRRQYHKRLGALVADLAREGATLEAYRPLSEVQHSLGLRADGTEVPATDEKVAAPRAQTKG
jgi:cytochrome P450